MKATEIWAQREFGRAQLGDGRRTRRAVELAARAAERPGAKVTFVVSGEAQREGAFRFMRNPKVDVAALARGSHEACVERCEPNSTFIVAVDQCSLGWKDPRRDKGLGRVGSKQNQTIRGLQAMTALAMSESGQVLGVCGQRWWRRPDEKSPAWGSDKRPWSERESSLWHRVIEDVESTVAASGRRARPWFQLDRGADAWHVLLEAKRKRRLLTVRAAYDRALTDERHDRLRAAISAQKPLAHFQHFLRPAAAKRAGHRPDRARRLQVRARKVTLRLTDWTNHKGKLCESADYWVVYVREIHPPPGAERLDWLLLTTRPVESSADALEVVRAYTLRWRVEEFHKTWKSGACNVEGSHLRSCEALKRWATLLAAVASRIERLKFAHRYQPNVPALDIASRDEIDGAIVLTERCRWKVGDDLTAQQFVLLVADIGGYTGKSSGGPPGSIVIKRGFDRVEVAARTLAAVRQANTM